MRRRGPRNRAARPDARLSAPPRLRAPAVRAPPGATCPGSSASWTTPPPRCSTPPSRVGARGLGLRRVRPLRRLAAGPARTAPSARPACLPSAPARSASSSRPSTAGPSPSAITRSRTSTSVAQEDIPRVRDLLAPLPGVARVLVGDERAELALDHPRSGEIVLLAEPDAWFAYPFWLDDAQRPRLRPHRRHPPQARLRPLRTLLRPRPGRPEAQGRPPACSARSSGFRTLIDLIPLDPSIVRGSHGLPADSRRRTAPS